MKINYKLQTEKEDIKYYNQKVTKLDTTYKLKLTTPYWISGSYLFELFPVNPEKDEDTHIIMGDPFYENERLNKICNWVITFHIHTISKCKDDDTFDATTGLNICETKAEIKALNIIRKFIIRIKEAMRLDESCLDTTITRLSKNYKNLDRLCK